MDYSKPLTKWQNDTLNTYSANEMRKLKTMSDKILRKLGVIEQYTLDDFYSVANMELMKSVFHYDVSKCDNFENYLKGNCERKFCTLLRDMQRGKRSDRREVIVDGKKVVINNKDVRLDATLKDDTETTIADTIGGSSMKEMFDDKQIQNEHCLKYLKNLNKKQKTVLSCLMDGYTKIPDIAKVTGYSNKEVGECLKRLRDPNKTRVLYRAKKDLEQNQ